LLRNKSDWISTCRELQVVGTKGKGRGRKTWNECVKEDIKRLGLRKILLIKITVGL